MTELDAPTPDDNRSKVWVLYALLMGVAICWSIQYPFWPNRTQLLDQGKLVDYSWISFALWAGGLVLWIWAMASLARELRGRTFSERRGPVLVTSAVLLGSFVTMYPTNAIDVFIYAARSRLLTHYGENPNGTQPVIHWDTDPYMAYASQEWADNLSPYGPLWNQLAAPVTWFGGDSIGAAVIGFKLLSVISALAIAWLVYDIVKARHPEWALVAALSWLWNPLVLWDGIGNAHNDVTLMVPVVAALWAWQKRHDHWVIPLLIASVFIKYVTIILLPIAVVAIWRRNPDWTERITGVLSALASTSFLLAISLYPFYDFDAIRDSASEQGAKVSFSPAWAVMASLSEFSIATVTPETILNVAYVIATLAIATCMVLCWQQPNRLLRASFEAMFVFMLVASTNQRAWYVIWLIPLAAILIPETPWRRALLWSVTAMLGHGCTIWLWYVWDFDAWGYYRYVMTIVGVVFLPVIILTAWELREANRSRDERSGVSARGRQPQTSPR